MIYASCSIYVHHHQQLHAVTDNIKLTELPYRASNWDNDRNSPATQLDTNATTVSSRFSKILNWTWASQLIVEAAHTYVPTNASTWEFFGKCTLSVDRLWFCTPLWNHVMLTALPFTAIVHCRVMSSFDIPSPEWLTKTLYLLGLPSIRTEVTSVETQLTLEQLIVKTYSLYIERITWTSPCIL